MTERTKAYWVGLLFVLVLILIGVFAWLMGVVGPFGRLAHYTVFYGFAGGVDVGSPVRVSGIKAGKVDGLEFLPAEEAKDGASVSVHIAVNRAASMYVRADSSFYINMAGIIGERYIEISPGSIQSPLLAEGSTIRGIDPPRIDQLLSQGYGVFERVQEFLEKNDKTVTEFLSNVSELMGEANQMFKGEDRKRLVGLLENLANLFNRKNTDKFMALVSDLGEVSREAKKLADGVQTEEAKLLYRRLMDIVEKAHEIDKSSLKKFLQEEGIRAHMF